MSALRWAGRGGTRASDQVSKPSHLVFSLSLTIVVSSRRGAPQSATRGQRQPCCKRCKTTIRWCARKRRRHWGRSPIRGQRRPCCKHCRVKIDGCARKRPRRWGRSATHRSYRLCAQRCNPTTRMCAMRRRLRWGRWTIRRPWRFCAQRCETETRLHAGQRRWLWWRWGRSRPRRSYRSCVKCFETGTGAGAKTQQRRCKRYYRPLARHLSIRQRACSVLCRDWPEPRPVCKRTTCLP